MPVASIAQPHQPAERVDLADQVSLRRSANGRIARHVRDVPFDSVQIADAAAQACGRPRRFDPGVSRADDDDVESSTR